MSFAVSFGSLDELPGLGTHHLLVCLLDHLICSIWIHSQHVVWSGKGEDGPSASGGEPVGEQRR